MIDDARDGPVRHSVLVPGVPREAFQAFTAGMTAWWPVENTFGRNEVRSVVIEPREGGRWLERDAGGRELEWGRVLLWEPPDRLILSWQITHDGQPDPDPERASVIEIRFVLAGEAATRIELEHRAFERHGAEGGAIWRAGMASDQGWPKILGCFVDALT